MKMKRVGEKKGSSDNNHQVSSERKEREKEHLRPDLLISPQLNIIVVIVAVVVAAALENQKNFFLLKTNIEQSYSRYNSAHSACAYIRTYVSLRPCAVQCLTSSLCW